MDHDDDDDEEEDDLVTDKKGGEEDEEEEEEVDALRDDIKRQDDDGKQQGGGEDEHATAPRRSSRLEYHDEEEDVDDDDDDDDDNQNDDDDDDDNQNDDNNNQKGGEEDAPRRSYRLEDLALRSSKQHQEDDEVEDQENDNDDEDEDGLEEEDTDDDDSVMNATYILERDIALREFDNDFQYDLQQYQEDQEAEGLDPTGEEDVMDMFKSQEDDLYDSLGWCDGIKTYIKTLRANNKDLKHALREVAKTSTVKLPQGVCYKIQDYMWVMWKQAKFVLPTDLMEPEPLAVAMYDFLTLTDSEKGMFTHLIPGELRSRLSTTRNNRVRSIKTKAYGKCDFLVCMITKLVSYFVPFLCYDPFRHVEC